MGTTKSQLCIAFHQTFPTFTLHFMEVISKMKEPYVGAEFVSITFYGSIFTPLMRPFSRQTYVCFSQVVELAFSRQVNFWNC